MFHKILAAMDNSAIAKQVFDEALFLAKASQAQLMLLHVLSSEEEGSPALPAFPNLAYSPMVSNELLTIYQKRWQEFEQLGLELLQQAQDEATRAGVSTEFTQNRGNPGRTICKLAQNWEADLIVIGRRGLSGLSELFMGSVSNYVLHHAPCSVLTVQHPIKISHSFGNQTRQAPVEK